MYIIPKENLDKVFQKAYGDSTGENGELGKCYRILLQFSGYNERNNVRRVQTRLYSWDDITDGHFDVNNDLTVHICLKDSMLQEIDDAKEYAKHTKKG